VSGAPEFISNLQGRPLRTGDYEKLERRWITRELADRALIRRVESLEGAELVGRPSRDGDFSGLIIPYIWPGHNYIREYRLRRDHPKIEIDPVKGRKEREKYLSPPGRGNMLYFAPGTELTLLAATELPIVIVEGEFKTLALWRLAWESAGEASELPAFLPIGLPGVWNWRKKERQPAADGGTEEVSVPISDLVHVSWPGRRVIILYDRNVLTNQGVKNARSFFTRHLQETRNAEVAWFEWPKKIPDQVNGIDDWLAVSGPAEALKLLDRARVRRRPRAVVVQIPGREQDKKTERDWGSDLITNTDGAVKPLLANVLAALRSAPEWAGVLAYNEFALRTVALKPPPWNQAHAGEWSDTADSLTSEWLQWNGIHVSSKLARESVEAVAREHGFHPVREYLDKLKWDSVPRLDAWLETYLGAKLAGTADAGQYSDYLHATGPRWLISAVARIYQPGCKADCCLILEGPQGIFKSTALYTLAGEWFTDEVADLGSKDSSMQVHGTWVIEIAELDSMSRAEVGKIKAFLSRRVDRFRPPYGARVIEVPRQCVFAGSVNHSTYLRDETGGRRFWPVECRRIDIDLLRRDRDQLWAEAVARYRAGAVWWLETAELEGTAEAEQLERYEGDAWDEAIGRWIKKPTERLDQQGHPLVPFTSNRESVTMADVLSHCIGKPVAQQSQADMNRVARYFRFMKWCRRRVGPRGSREWRYFRSKTARPTGAAQ
jgi:predicted P-loop ATPase